MTRGELKEKVAMAVTNVSRLRDGRQPLLSLDGLLPYDRELALDRAEAALSVIEGAGLAVVPVEATAQPVSTAVRHRLETAIDGANNWPLDTAALYRAMIEAGRVR